MVNFRRNPSFVSKGSNTAMSSVQNLQAQLCQLLADLGDLSNQLKNQMERMTGLLAQQQHNAATMPDDSAVPGFKVSMASWDRQRSGFDIQLKALQQQIKKVQLEMSKLQSKIDVLQSKILTEISKVQCITRSS